MMDAGYWRGQSRLAHRPSRSFHAQERLRQKLRNRLWLTDPAELHALREVCGLQESPGARITGDQGPGTMPGPSMHVFGRADGSVSAA